MAIVIRKADARSSATPNPPTCSLGHNHVHFIFKKTHTNQSELWLASSVGLRSPSKHRWNRTFGLYISSYSEHQRKLYKPTCECAFHRCTATHRLSVSVAVFSSAVVEPKDLYQGSRSLELKGSAPQLISGYIYIQPYILYMLGTLSWQTTHLINVASMPAGSLMYITHRTIGHSCGANIQRLVYCNTSAFRTHPWLHCMCTHQAQHH